ncbi:PilZ domain-containing protein [Sphingomonas glacialis]|uniref:PilZ domain-containing protein n=1 Tax=Sphingomonas glacialis TaxID=658225 RepID=A0A502FFW7_9SPHN|nr:PilZ domain-containing protein [Sphingomonas glacialis]
MQQREYRITTRAPARLRHGLCWSDVLVRNVSRRGFMLELKNPPASGTMIELRRGQIVVIGQVTWVRDGPWGCAQRMRSTSPSSSRWSVRAPPGSRATAIAACSRADAIATSRWPASASRAPGGGRG